MTLPSVSRREREMMEVIFRLGRATAAEVMEGLASPPSYSAVRATLRNLEEKGHLRHEAEANRYVYVPTVPAGEARRSALRSVLQTFFGGSPKRAMVALLDEAADDLSRKELDEIQQLIQAAKSKRK